MLHPPTSCLHCPDSGPVPGATAPNSVPADPRGREPAWPQPSPSPLLTSIKAIIWHLKPYYAISQQLASHMRKQKEEETT